jgi:hypothetical protein
MIEFFHVIDGKFFALDGFCPMMQGNKKLMIDFFREIGGNFQ